MLWQRITEAGDRANNRTLFIRLTQAASCHTGLFRLGVPVVRSGYADHGITFQLMSRPPLRAHDAYNSSFRRGGTVRGASLESHVIAMA